MTVFAEDFDWQRRFLPHYAEIATNVVRIQIASWDDDTRRNTDMVVGTLADGHRLACRARRRTDDKGVTRRQLPLYLRQFTVRLSRPTGAPTEMDKLRDGWGDFMIYGWEAEPDAARLSPWVLINLRLLCEYLAGGGRWMRERNRDGSSDFAAFDLFDLPLACVLNAEGLPLGCMSSTITPRPCRVCGRPCWGEDQPDGCRLHVCCDANERSHPGAPCPQCAESDKLNRYHYGWPT